MSEYHERKLVSFQNADNLGLLSKVYRVYESNRLIEEFKTFPSHEVGSLAMKVTYSYVLSGSIYDQITTSAIISTWRDFMEAAANPPIAPLSDIDLSTLSITDVSSGSTAATISSTGGRTPIVYSIVSDPSNVFIIDGTDLNLTQTLDFETSYDVTIRATTDDDCILDEAFTLTTIAESAYNNLFGLNLDGVDEYGQCSPTVFDAATTFSIEHWVDWDMTATNTKYLIGKVNGTDKLQLQWINSQIRFEINSSRIAASPTRADKLYHIVMVYNGAGATDADRAKLYVDGVDIGSVSVAGVPTSIPASLTGIDTFIAARDVSIFHQGLYVQTSFFNTNISPSDVTTLYNSGTPIDPTTVTGCTNAYYMGDNAADTNITIKDNVGTDDITLTNVEPGDIILR